MLKTLDFGGSSHFDLWIFHSFTHHEIFQTTFEALEGPFENDDNIYEQLIKMSDSPATYHKSSIKFIILCVTPAEQVQKILLPSFSRALFAL